MTNQPIPTCGTHHTPKEWLPTTFEYREENISIRIPNVSAWVCPIDSEVSFTPATVDELMATVRELYDTAKRAKQRRSLLTEYIVSVA